MPVPSWLAFGGPDIGAKFERAFRLRDLARQRGQQRQAAMQQQQDTRLMRDVFRRQYAVDPSRGETFRTGVIGELFAKGRPEKALEVQGKWTQIDKAKADIHKSLQTKSEDEFKTFQNRFNKETLILSKALGSVTPDYEWEKLIEFREQKDPDARQKMGEYSEAKARKMLQYSMPYKDVLSLEDKRRKESIIGKLQQDKLKAETIEAEVNAAQALSKEERGYQKQFSTTPKTKTFGEIERNFKVMDNLWDRHKKNVAAGKPAKYGALDQALITLFNKLLDPTSVVRESEYARTPENQAYLDALWGKLKAAQAGGAGLVDEFRQELMDVSETLYDAAEDGYSKHTNTFIDASKRAGFEPRFVVGDRALEIHKKYYGKVKEKEIETEPEEKKPWEEEY